MFSPRSQETQLLVHRALGNAETSSVLGRAGAQCQGSCWAWIHGVPGCPACLAPLLWALPHSAALGEPLKHSFYKIRWVWEVSVITRLLKPVAWCQRSVSADIRCSTSKVTEGLRLRSPAGLRNIWTEQRFPPPGMWVMWCCCGAMLLLCDAAVVSYCWLVSWQYSQSQDSPDFRYQPKGLQPDMAWTRSTSQPSRSHFARAAMWTQLIAEEEIMAA